MRSRRESSASGLAEATYVELVRSLFHGLLPSAVMSGLFVLVAVLAVHATGDGWLAGLGAAGALLSAPRLWVVAICRRDVASHAANRRAAEIHERRFAASHVSFAAVLGVFGARAFALPPVGLHMVVAALLVGYAAGVAAGVALRPGIALTSMVAAVVLAAVVALGGGDAHHAATGVVLLALLAGGAQSVRWRYRAEVARIELAHTMSGLAKTDPLTGLYNRLGLAERFSETVGAGAADWLIAVHCIDLDRFKPVNDRYGHPAGDELLRAVARRLAASLCQGDVACRTGGDEFVILQPGLRHADEAHLLARRLARTLCDPYAIGEHVLSVGASVGFAVSRCDEPLDRLIGQADNALYAIKAAGGGAAGHSDKRIGKVTAGR